MDFKTHHGLVLIILFVRTRVSTTLSYVTHVCNVPASVSIYQVEHKTLLFVASAAYCRTVRSNVL